MNGSVAELGMQVDPDRDVVMVGGRRVRTVKSAWIALNKPVGYLVSRHDPRGRPTIFEMLPDIPGLSYVGRLDYMTAGLLLLTTDGGAANRLMHPRYRVERTYRALVHGRSVAEIRRRLAQPVVIDGRAVQIVKTMARSVGRGSADLTVTLAEGRYRIVRRLCETVGLQVERLTRLSYGPIHLGKLQLGRWRHFTTGELRRLRDLEIVSGN